MTSIDNLNVEEYKKLKVQGYTDQQILSMYGYSPHSEQVILRWKTINGISGRGKVDFLDPKEVKELARTMSYRAIARYYKMNWNTFQKFLRIQRRLGNFI